MTTRPEYPLGPPMIGALMRMPMQAVLARIFRDLDDAGFTDLVPAHFPVLRYPGPEGRAPSELARQANMTKQAMNYLLGQLEQLGYLTREGDPRDKRFKLVRLTERGHAVGRAIRESVAEIQKELSRELNPERFDQLHHLLIELNATRFVREFHQAEPEASPTAESATDPA